MKGKKKILNPESNVLTCTSLDPHQGGGHVVGSELRCWFLKQIMENIMVPDFRQNLFLIGD